jgi:hypothetical protein
MNVGELSPFRGMTYAEIASVSRSQHLSQGFGALQRRGTSLDYVKLEASHVSPPIAPEKSMFETLGMGWGRFRREELPAQVRAPLDSLDAVVAAVRKVEDLTYPERMVGAARAVVGLLGAARARRCLPAGTATRRDARASRATSRCRSRRRSAARRRRCSPRRGARRGDRAARAAGGARHAAGHRVGVQPGPRDVVLEGASVWMQNRYGPPRRTAGDASRRTAAARVTLPLVSERASVPWWMENGMQPGADMFRTPRRRRRRRTSRSARTVRRDAHVRARCGSPACPFVSTRGR